MRKQSQPRSIPLIDATVCVARLQRKFGFLVRTKSDAIPISALNIHIENAERRVDVKLRIESILNGRRFVGCRLIRAKVSPRLLQSSRDIALIGGNLIACISRRALAGKRTLILLRIRAGGKHDIGLAIAVVCRVRLAALAVEKPGKTRIRLIACKRTGEHGNVHAAIGHAGRKKLHTRYAICNRNQKRLGVGSYLVAIGARNGKGTQAFTLPPSANSLIKVEVTRETTECVYYICFFGAVGECGINAFLPIGQSIGVVHLRNIKSDNTRQGTSRRGSVSIFGSIIRVGFCPRVTGFAVYQRFACPLASLGFINNGKGTQLFADNRKSATRCLFVLKKGFRRPVLQQRHVADIALRSGQFDFNLSVSSKLHLIAGNINQPCVVEIKLKLPVIKRGQNVLCVLIRVAGSRIIHNKLRAVVFQRSNNTFFCCGHFGRKARSGIREIARNHVGGVVRLNVASTSTGQINRKPHLHSGVAAQRSWELLIRSEGVVAAIVKQLHIKRTHAAIALGIRAGFRAI